MRKIIKEITKEQLDAVVRNGQRIIEEHKKLDAMIAEDEKTNSKSDQNK